MRSESRSAAARWRGMLRATSPALDFHDADAAKPARWASRARARRARRLRGSRGATGHPRALRHRRAENRVGTGTGNALAGQIVASVGAGAGGLVVPRAAVAVAVPDVGGGQREGRQTLRFRIAVKFALRAGASARFVAAVGTVAVAVVDQLQRQPPLPRLAHESSAPHLTQQRR